jgi:drug/metabolite transporter (DMT)-like permease
MISAEIISGAAGLASAITWGAGDFAGGAAARRGNAIFTVLAVNLIGMVLAVLAAGIAGESLPPFEPLMWGIGAGLVGASGLVAFYRALATGKMGTVAPVTGVVAAAIPVIIGSFAEGLPEIQQYIGFGLALAGVWLASSTSDGLNLNAAFWLAVLGGVGFAGFYVLMNQAGDASLFWVLAAAKGSSTVLIAITMLASRVPFRAEQSAWTLLGTAGTFDILGNVFYLIAAQAGRLDVAVVLTSFYPATTMLLAWLVLKEHITRVHLFGIGLMLVALPLIVV